MSAALPASPPLAPHPSAEAHGLLWGLLGVAIFAFTLPMTRLAVGTPEAPQLSGAFVAIGRAAIAGLLSAALLLLQRAPLPARQDWAPLALTSLGVVFGFPLLTSLAMRHVAAVHASVVIGLLPLATALVGALLHRQRPSPRFWLCALAGTALVVAFALRRSDGGLALHPADALLLAAVLCAAVGYGFGGRLSQRMPAGAVICWALVLALPVTLPVAGLTFPSAPVAPSAWAALAYVSVFSMWLGFFAWYRGLALGGTVRVSQVQLVQPFLGMLFAVPLLGERLDAVSLGFGIAVMATVFIGRRAPTRVRAVPASPPRS
ncbi:DMT family transporter [Acidovorax sp. GBBC 3334]|uniref:DMT family transporter n=1 Tax=unclassified Acidovorax TaxID=2684926 RepID=UPI00230454CA|nr:MULTISPECIES: DMT family transporter [unclassified Acidovorax]MDA8455954.1 DMT family transporter [Acidovorax sp. GBBC 3334]MDA8523731.1 DMT family transporter [Acidovorax sp. NCPPB 4044]